MTSINAHSSDSKIKSPWELADLVSSWKSQGRCVVHCHGDFDLIHPGHIRHLEASRREGDLLIVTVAADDQVSKGPGRPLFNEQLRAESLAALQCVDYISIGQWPTAAEAIQVLRPSVYATGGVGVYGVDGVTAGSDTEKQAVLSVGGRIFFTDEIKYSSSHLINSHFDVFSQDTEAWLQSFRDRYSIDDVLGYLERSAGLKVLVVGEAIIDEYVFCDGLGRSTKDPILAFHYRSEERQAGGSLAVANHLAGFCSQVGLITMIGDTERCEDFIRESLQPNVNVTLVDRRGSPTIHKRRFVDTHTGAKMFELYLMEDAPLDPEDEATLVQKLADEIAGYDLVLVTDYGHGMLAPAAVATLCDKSRFLAVNTQANAGNRGFNTISKYPRADYVCLAGHEVSLETRMRYASWQELVLEVTSRIECPKFTITHGRDGTVHYDQAYGFTEVPALATRVTDRTGAGDAVLAVTSLLVAQNAPWDITGFVGNLAGAQLVGELGNRTTMDATSMSRHVTSLMK